MSVWNNFVQCNLLVAMSVDSTTAIVSTAPTGWSNVPDPAGDIAYLTLLDDIATPTKFEIISYTGLAGTGPFTLTGVTRGVENTTPTVWSVGAYVIQNITANSLDSALQLGTLTTGKGLTGAETPVSLGEDLNISLSVEELVASILSNNEQNYVPVYDSSLNDTVKVRIRDIVDGGTF
jgi:hypothetical protein